jgi:hypothetical protein
MPLALAWTAMVNEMPRRPRSFKVAVDCYGRVKGMVIFLLAFTCRYLGISASNKVLGAPLGRDLTLAHWTIQYLTSVKANCQVWVMAQLFG